MKKETVVSMRLCNVSYDTILCPNFFVLEHADFLITVFIYTMSDLRKSNVYW